MAYKLITKCPVCSSNLRVKKLQCAKCNTIIENDFELTSFLNLNSEQLYFAEVFIKNRGNIKDVEKELGISYPTVRAKLDDVIEALGYSIPKPKSSSKSDIINMLENGEISPDDAIKMLNE